MSTDCSRLVTHDATHSNDFVYVDGRLRDPL